MSFGIANSLPEAVQCATTGLANWLQHDYKLEPNELAMVLGTAIQYNIAELVDPRCTSWPKSARAHWRA
jgi:amidase